MSESTPTPAPAEGAAPAPAPAKPANIPGIIALVLGIVAFVFAVIPVLSFIAWLPGLAAIVLGIVGLVVKNRPKAMAGIGLGLGVVAIIVGIIVSIVTALAAVTTSVGAVIEEQEQQAAEVVDLTFDVTGTGTANISYSYEADGKDISESSDDVALPFSLTVQVERGGLLDFKFFTVTATSTEEGELACALTLDGKVLAEDKSSGSFNIVTCMGSSADLDD